MHSYTGPSGTRYHLNVEGSAKGNVFMNRNGIDVRISMRDVLWLAALHKRSQLISIAEEASDFEILGLPNENKEG